MAVSACGMALISLKDVSVQFGGPAVLDRVSVNIEPGERTCLTGRNGEGKSTLLKVMAGLIEPDSGEIIRQAALKVAFLTQDLPTDSEGSVFEVVTRGLPRDDRGHVPGAERYLTQLGVPQEGNFNALSGGMRRRALLARALAVEPDLLLLDEPTNHLDIEAIEWLESYLQRGRCAVLFVTHDRAFLRKIARRVLDLDRGQLAGWNCDYTTFLRRKEELLSDEAVFWERKNRLLAQEEAWIRRGVKARTTRNEGRVAALKKLRAEFSQRRLQSGSARMQMDVSEGSGALALKVRGLNFGYQPDQLLIQDFSTNILRGERIGIIGANGSGKSTLLQLLCGRLQPLDGEVTRGARVELAYLDQLRSQIDLERSVAQNLAGDHEEVVVNGVRKHLYGYLNNFLFTAERARTPLKALSGGERARLLLAKLFLQPGNLMLLDEPTNDLDMETLELLEEQLQSYAGTLLLVTHDRAFLDNVVTSTLVLEGGGRVGHYPGGYSDWLRQRPPPPVPKAGKARAAPQQRNPREGASRRLSYHEQRELALLPERIAALEQEVERLQQLLSDTTLYQKEPAAALEAQQQLQSAATELEERFEAWIELSERGG